MSRTLFTNAMIFEGTSKDLVPGEVLVQANRIHCRRRTRGNPAARRLRGD